MKFVLILITSIFITMTMNKSKVTIIGGGLSGLIAALVLEENGYTPLILEATDRPGGRLKTDIINGFQLDHGFQVLLSSYPAAQKYLDYDKLDLQYFKSGSHIFINGKQKTIGDPLRDLSVLFPSLFSGIGTLSDKLKVLKLNRALKSKSLIEIFEEDETSTYTYLKSLGFSNCIIENFFRPFFSGIYLETELSTSSRMFEFVFKMFGEGFAVLPKGGIEEIPKQIISKLNRTDIRCNTKVGAVSDSHITLENGDQIESDYIIIATEAKSMMQNLSEPNLDWKSCQTLYFSTAKRKFKQAYIGLVTKKNLLANNLFYHTSLDMAKKGDGELLSVTVVNETELSEEVLVEKIKKELKEECGIDDLTFIKNYKIKRALPKLDNLKYKVAPLQSKLTDKIFLAGDVQLNSSSNGAIISGETAALGVIEAINRLV